MSLLASSNGEVRAEDASLTSFHHATAAVFPQALVQPPPLFGSQGGDVAMPGRRTVVGCCSALALAFTGALVNCDGL